MTNVLYVSSQEPLMSSQVTDDDGGVLDTLLIILEIQNCAHMFGGTYDHKLFGQWAESPSCVPKVHQSPPHELE